MTSLMRVHSRLALRTTAASKAILHRLPAVVASSQARAYSTSTSGSGSSSSSSSTSAADIISAWKTSILQKPVLLERDTIRPQTLQMLLMTLNKSTPPPSSSSSSTITTSVPPKANETSFHNGSPLPINWHHTFFPPMIGEQDLGQDGYEMTHAPPAPFLARMWAGGGVEQNPRNLLRVGQDMIMKTKCTGVDIKTSREGKVMVFVSLEKLIENENGLALTDTRTLVYMEKDRESPVKPKLVKPRKQADVTMDVHPTAIQLFRYSALTFNSHRIHFDHEYANKVEDHPACLVHGPLSATLMLEPLRHNLLLTPGKVIKNFRYRALSPLYVDQPIKICAKKLALIPTMDADVEECYEVWVENSQGGLAMSGTVEVVTEQEIQRQ